ncbi:cation diffusion facilitator CzcD-associated flavoprotein CzcO [Humitalea rosea]|uniref:Cation diffusion facilitator CzcD-associated flavoprotein CzcO n=1 Tax=Humitalea rosea TaxID=990373 RepID=A0A2W7IWJ3_9PROT|nr:NAD(P)/FAD-dependent oxidoreductase [Humitalea rosea]PZW43063.1 cation diffusion facilitator CzcD-associated flavoprotein CzcO [Humitalea rosea]
MPAPFASSSPDPLARLADQARREMEALAYPAAPWVEPRRAPDGTEALDCAIIGGGQYGLTIAAGLRREQVRRIAVFDMAAEGFEGPWATFARMTMLRTPKHLTGPELGLPGLGFRAWWEAQHGEAGWEAMFRIPREAWMDYLRWYRRVLELPVRNGWRLAALEPVAGGEMLRLGFATDAGPREIFVRSCVLAAGSSGAHGHPIPAAIGGGLPAGRALHANDVFDVGMLKGERVGVLGAGATAFDLSTVALQAGAASVDLCLRRESLPLNNPRRWMETAGFLGQYAELPDAIKWAYVHRLGVIGQPPPQPTYDKAMAQPGFRIQPGSPWEDVSWNGQEVVVRGAGRRFAFDRVVVATGMHATLHDMPEYAAVVAAAACWRDRYTPPEALRNARMGANPYLGRHAGFVEREPGAGPWLDRVMMVMGGAGLSLGPIAASVSGMKYVVPRVVEGVKRRLFLDQQDGDWARFCADTHAELSIGAA